MRFEKMAIPEVVLLTPKMWEDERGYFREVFRQNLFEDVVGAFAFVQDNEACSVSEGTIRGLHFQVEPKAQGKLVSCLSGAILDVAVDLRSGSPSYGRHVSAKLTADNGCRLWVPPGFAHGYCTLEPATKVGYSVTEYYDAHHDRGLAFDDPALGIAWPVSRKTAVLSPKDVRQPGFAELGSVFTYRPAAAPVAL